MRGLDETPLDPEMLAALDVIDATLAGEAVDPEHAELAELALLLADQRPQVEPGFAVVLLAGGAFTSSGPRGFELTPPTQTLQTLHRPGSQAASSAAAAPAFRSA